MPIKPKSLIKAVRLHCFVCCGWDPRNPDSRKPYKAVRQCRNKECFLHAFRMGKNPFQGGGKGDVDRIRRAEIEAVLF